MTKVYIMKVTEFQLAIFFFFFDAWDQKFNIFTLSSDIVVTTVYPIHRLQH